jgi:hypothetical protein
VAVPKTNTDPVASLTPAPLVLRVGGYLFDAPAQPAVYWLGVLLDPDPDFWDLFPGCLEEADQDLVNEALLEGSLEIESLDAVCLELITTIGARPWWVTIRLIEIARSNWQVLGAEMLLRGVDAAVISLAGWLDVLLLLIMRQIDPKEATMFTMKLEQVPPGLEAEQPEPEISQAAFMSMA